MNLSIYANSLGTYQLFKLLCVPTIIVIKYLKAGEVVSRKVMVALAILLAGVGCATVTDVTLSSTGLMIGLGAVVSTSQFQIFQGSCQSSAGVTAIQATASVTPYQAAFAGGIALFVEVPGKNSVLDYEMSATAAVLMVCSCAGAVAVNLAAFALIGKTSAVTYQVVGHAKTVLIFTASFILFPFHGDVVSSLFSITLAIAGAVLYGHIKAKAKAGEPD
ncbi:drug/Metabolite transporter superfamily protein, partial [Thecamonas trahens ATCC 50062]